MRKRRISYVGALGLALAVAIPGPAFGAGDQEVQAGFQPSFGASNVTQQPPPSVDVGDKLSKAGTLYTRLFLQGFAAPVPEAAIFDIHAPGELKFNTKGLARCDPNAIRNQSADQARQICGGALLGNGFAEAWLGGPTLRGDVVLFNGTPQNGHTTVLFHSTAGTPVTLVSEMQNSPLPGFGTLFRTRVAQSAGGGVPDGIPIVDTGFTISKKYTDKAILKKAKRAKKQGNTKKYRQLKKKSKKSWVQGQCTDGELTTRIDVTYVSGPPQTDSISQPCT
jgi:hypothetical protein